jgi:hypothetical protein
MAFHVDGRGTCGLSQVGLALGADDDVFGTGKDAFDHTFAKAWGRGEVFPEPRRCLPAIVSRHHFGRDDHVTGIEVRVETSRNAEADNAADPRGIEHAQKVAQLLRIA